MNAAVANLPLVGIREIVGLARRSGSAARPAGSGRTRRTRVTRRARVARRPAGRIRVDAEIGETLEVIVARAISVAPATRRPCGTGRIRKRVGWRISTPKSQ